MRITAVAAAAVAVVTDQSSAYSFIRNVLYQSSVNRTARVTGIFCRWWAAA